MMARLFAIILILAGLWRGWMDYQATLAKGYALRFERLGETVYDLAPGLLETVGDQRWLAPILKLPLSPVLLGLGLLIALFASRRRRRFRP